MHGHAVQDVVLCVKMGEGLAGEAATRGESMCCQQTTGQQIMPAFATVLGIQHARSVLIQPIRSLSSLINHKAQGAVITVQEKKLK